MLVIEIISAVAVLVGLYVAVIKFNAHCSARFGHKFFTSGTLMWVLAALLLIFGGEFWYSSAAQNHGSILNGIVLIGLGATALIAMVWQNIRRTNLVYGVGGSAIQIPALAFLAYLGLPVLVIAVIAYIIFVSRATPVWVVNR
jgi:hypothetical protein